MFAKRCICILAVCAILLGGPGCREKETTKGTIEVPGGKYEFKVKTDKVPD
jgi:hypothetical protein